MEGEMEGEGEVEVEGEVVRGMHYDVPLSYQILTVVICHSQ